MDHITYRQGIQADSYQMFYLFEQTLADLLQSMGFHEPTSFQRSAVVGSNVESAPLFV